MGETPQELTWELAAESALFRIFSRGVLEQPGEDPEPSDPILELRSNLAYLVHNYLASSSAAGGPDSQIFVQFWELLGFRAAKELHRLGEIPDSTELAAKKVGVLLASKQRDTDTKISPASDALV